MKNFRDSSDTGIVGGEISKTSERIEAIGNIDELNSLVGKTRSEIKDEQIMMQLRDIQTNLWEIGADLADPMGSKKVAIEKSDVEKLENVIRETELNLKAMSNFILTFESSSAASLDLCRAVARRSERSIARLMEKEEINVEIFRYVNRLSDVFFALARLENKLDGKEEIKWLPGK